MTKEEVIENLKDENANAEIEGLEFVVIPVEAIDWLLNYLEEKQGEKP